MTNAYGFVEITGVVAAVQVIDVMCKASGATLVTWERKWGGRLVTVIVKGDVSAVHEAINAAKANGIKNVTASGVLPNPHAEIVRLIDKSARKWC